MKKSILLAIAALLIIAPSCRLLINNEAVVINMSDKSFDGCWEQERLTDYFTGIVNASPMDVIFERTDSSFTTVHVQGDEALADTVVTEVKNGTLYVRLKKGTYQNLHLRVKVTAPGIEALQVAGSGDIKSSTELSCPTLLVAVAGSGDIELSSVKCDSLDVKVAGSGDIEINNIEARNVNAQVAGSGDIEIKGINATGILNLSVLGSGDIEVKGTAAKVNAEVIGSGDITGKVDCAEINSSKKGSGTIKLN